MKNVKLLNCSSASTTDPVIDNDSKITENETELILFARADREKEEWFNLFKKASKSQLPSSYDYMKSTNSITSNNTTIIPNKKSIDKSENISLSYSASNDTVSLKNMTETNNCY